jgi:hypothetical protein
VGGRKWWRANQVSVRLERWTPEMANPAGDADKTHSMPWESHAWSKWYNPDSKGRAWMKTRGTYKGHVIACRVIPLRDGGWKAHLSIEKHRGPFVLDTPFETGQRIPTPDAALEASLRMGMYKIDRGFVAAISD